MAKNNAWYLKYSGGRWPKGKREVKKIQQKQKKEVKKKQDIYRKYKQVRNTNIVIVQ